MTNDMDWITRTRMEADTRLDARRTRKDDALFELVLYVALMLPIIPGIAFIRVLGWA